jgi:hypothetical protein
MIIGTRAVAGEHSNLSGKKLYFPFIPTEMSEKLHANHSFPERNL